MPRVDREAAFLLMRNLAINLPQPAAAALHLRSTYRVPARHLPGACAHPAPASRPSIPRAACPRAPAERRVQVARYPFIQAHIRLSGFDGRFLSPGNPLLPVLDTKIGGIASAQNALAAAIRGCWVLYLCSSMAKIQAFDRIAIKLPCI